MKKESFSKKNFQVLRKDKNQASAVADVNDEEKEINIKGTALERKTEDPMKAEVKVCFDLTDVCETESLTPQGEKELPVDCSWSILKDDIEKEKVIDEYVLEIASSKEGKSLYTEGEEIKKEQNGSSGGTLSTEWVFLS